MLIKFKYLKDFSNYLIYLVNDAQLQKGWKVSAAIKLYLLSLTWLTCVKAASLNVKMQGSLTDVKSKETTIYSKQTINIPPVCFIFRLPDGLTRRGDVNLLRLGDPGTAKSQLLKFVERVPPSPSTHPARAAVLLVSVLRSHATHTR